MKWKYFIVYFQQINEVSLVCVNEASAGTLWLTKRNLMKRDSYWNQGKMLDSNNQYINPLIGIPPPAVSITGSSRPRRFQVGAFFVVLAFFLPSPVRDVSFTHQTHPIQSWRTHECCWPPTTIRTLTRITNNHNCTHLMNDVRMYRSLF